MYRMNVYKITIFFLREGNSKSWANCFFKLTYGFYEYAIPDNQTKQKMKHI